MPAARAGETLYAGLHAADRDRAGRRQQARILPPRHVQLLLEAAEIGPSGRKANHGDAVVAGDMARSSRSMPCSPPYTTGMRQRRVFMTGGTGSCASATSFALSASKSICT